MTNKTITLARVRAADSLYLTMWPNDTLHECETGNPKWNACLNAIDAGYTKEVSAALADPVPPAGRGVYSKPADYWEGYKGHVCYKDTHDLKKMVQHLESVLDDVPEGELVDRAHITRLQAEVDKRGFALDTYLPLLNSAIAERNALQSELIKALELLGLSSEAFSVLQGMVEHCLNVRACMGMDEGFKDFDTEEEHDFVKELRAFLLSNQSAPADKGQDYPEGKRERFQKWVLATKHPVLGFLDGHWLARGDDREGYASEYVQGLWVAYKAFSPEHPAPVARDGWAEKMLRLIDQCIPDKHKTPGYSIVAVVQDALNEAQTPPVAVILPKRIAADDLNEIAQGWNCCLDAVERLNP